MLICDKCLPRPSPAGAFSYKSMEMIDIYFTFWVKYCIFARLKRNFMKDKIFINGNVLVKNGVFYAGNCVVMYASEDEKKDAKVIEVPSGTLEVEGDYGSIFNDYYIRGRLTIQGESDVEFIFEDQDRTYSIYKDCIQKVERLIDESEIPESLISLFYQQQFSSVFGALELFLFNTFMRQVCNNYSAYNDVISANLRCFERCNEDKRIAKGENCLEKEKWFIEKTQNVVYHNVKQVKDIFHRAFNINVELDLLEDEINMRNDITHRMGYTVKGKPIVITDSDVLALIGKIDIIVENLNLEIKKNL